MHAIRLTRALDLTAHDWHLWRDIIATTPIYDSPYFHPEFTRAVATVRDDVEIAVLERSGATVGFFPFQRGRLNLGKPVGGKLSDYHGPIVGQNATLDPQELLHACRLAAWDFDHLVCASSSLAPFITIRARSPYLDLHKGFESYARHRREAGSDVIARVGQKRRKLAREVGELRFDYDADDPAAWQSLLEWKSAQYVRTGLADVFSFPWTRALIERLRKPRGGELTAPLSVLRAGDQVAAVTLSLRSAGVLHAWFTAYNPALERYSPGLVLFVWLAEQASSLAITKIDLGRGEERYKGSLASAATELGEGTLSTASLAVWLRSGWRTSRDWLTNSPLKDSMCVLKPIREWIAYR